MTLTVRLSGFITAVGPITVSPPITSDEAARRKSRDDRAARLPRMPIYLDGVEVQTAYLPASSIRGSLRHKSTAAIISALATKQKKLRVDEYMTLALGGIKDKKNENEENRGVDIAAVAKFRRDNPMVSLFGSFANGIGGHLAVSHGIPEKPYNPASDTLVTGVRMNPLRNPDAVAIFDPADLDAYLEKDRATVRANALKQPIEAAKTKLRAAKRKDGNAEDAGTLEAEIATLEGKRSALEKEGDRSVNVQQPLPGYEFLPAGIKLRQSMTLTRTTVEELAILIAGLANMAADPFVGGHRARGCGEYMAEWDVFEAGYQSHDVTQSLNSGRISFGGPDSVGTINVTAKDGTALAEAKKVMANLSNWVDKIDFAAPVE